MTPVGRERVVLGCDPGTFSLGLALLTGGILTQVYADEWEPKDRKPAELMRPKALAEYVAVFQQTLDATQPDAVAIEAIVPQPWVAGGRIPRGTTALADAVLEMAAMVNRRGTFCYLQSPNIQSDYSNAEVDLMIRAAMGRDYKILPHLRSALKHALRGDYTYMLARKGA